MPTDGVNKRRRRFLVATTSAVGAVGVGFAAVPFIKSWKPSAKAQAVGAPVQVSLNGLKPGQIVKVQWRGQTIGVLRRSPETLALLPELDDALRDPASQESEQPEFAQNEGRALREEFLVVMPGTPHDIAFSRADQWRAAFGNSCVQHEGRILQVTFSAGVATYPVHGATDEEIIQAADRALYTAKKSGRNRVVMP